MDPGLARHARRKLLRAERHLLRDVVGAERAERARGRDAQAARARPLGDVPEGGDQPGGGERARRRQELVAHRGTATGADAGVPVNPLSVP